VLPDVIDPGDVATGDAASESDFVPKQRNRPRIADQLLPQHLEREQLIELDIPYPIDAPTRANPKQRQQLVPATVQRRRQTRYIQQGVSPRQARRLGGMHAPLSPFHFTHLVSVIIT
jgi:hypothetical protein